MKKYLVMRRWNDKSVGDVINLDSESPHTQRDLLTGFIELVKGPFGLEQKGLRLRVCEYQKRILKGEVMPGEIVFLRGVVPPTIARIRSRDNYSNAFLVNMGAGRDAFMVDFDPIDWSEYWVDTGLRIQKWNCIAASILKNISQEGVWGSRPGASEAAAAELARRKRGRKSFDVKDVEVTVGGHKVTGVDENFAHEKGEGFREEIEEYARAVADIPVIRYSKHGAVLDKFAERRRLEGLDRQAMREKIATRIGVSTRHISEDSINYELAIKGAAQVATHLAKARAPENAKMAEESFSADVRQFLADRFDHGFPPSYSHRMGGAVVVRFGEIKIGLNVNFDGAEGGVWQWNDTAGQDGYGTASSLSAVCDDFEAWVCDQFVEEEPAAPREVVTYHIGTSDMGSRGTGGHR